MATDDAVQFLHDHGLCDGGVPRVRSLTGGISSDVFLVRCGGDAVVVKRALERFRVPQLWRVSTARLAIEFAFAHLLADRLRPTAVATPLAFDAAKGLLALRYVPPPFQDWKRRLLSGTVEPAVADAAGRLLARIHRLGLSEPGLRKTFEQPGLFEEQRIEPYFLATAKRQPSAADGLTELAIRLRDTRTTLIHGDFSPKNILTDGRRVTLIDHEVATWGDPRFDVAFLLNHLLLKSLHRPARRAQLIALCRTFLAAYARARGPAPADPWTGRVVGALMLARVDGKSPVEYLSERQVVRAHENGLDLLLGPPRDVNALLADWPPAA